MAHLKLHSLARALAVGSGALMLTACSTVSDVWDFATDDSDASLREPTGYYDHTDVQEHVDPLVVPADLATPMTDRTLEVPAVQASDESRTLVGARMDVRPPVVSQVSEMGVEIVNNGEDAIVWFLPYSTFNVTSQDQAWQMLNNALSFLRVPVAESNPMSYAIATGPMDYNSFGEPYDEISSGMEAYRYSQVYKVAVGSSSSGLVGFNVSLVSSSSYTGDGDAMGDYLNPRQRRSFTTGFANSLIKALVMQSKQGEIVPDNVNVFLGRDNNDQDALIVPAPYQSTWNVMRGLLEQYGFTVDEYSISRSSFNVSFEELNAEDYRALGVEPFNLVEGEYIVRLAVSGEQTVITFYDEDDKPLSATTVAAMYPGLSQAIAREFAIYKSDGVNYLAKFSEED